MRCKAAHVNIIGGCLLVCGIKMQCFFECCLLFKTNKVRNALFLLKPWKLKRTRCFSSFKLPLPSHQLQCYKQCQLFSNAFSAEMTTLVYRVYSITNTSNAFSTIQRLQLCQNKSQLIQKCFTSTFQGRSV